MIVIGDKNDDDDVEVEEVMIKVKLIEISDESVDELNEEDYKKTIFIMLTQAKEQFDEGKLDKAQYNALLFQAIKLYTTMKENKASNESMKFQ